MISTFGKNIKVSISGGSHEPQMNITIEGLPMGFRPDFEKMQAFLDRRAPGNSTFATSRKEADIPQVVSGLFNGTTFGPPLSLCIKNTNTRSADYESLRDIPRPGHADYTAFIKYGESINMSGGGPFSARMTAPLCVAGAIALQILGKQGIEIGAHIYSIHDVEDEHFDPVHITSLDLEKVRLRDFPVLSPDAGEKMKKVILNNKEAYDSVGGIVEVCALNVPCGIGAPMYDGLESILAPIFFGIPAVKGLEFGAGFDASKMKGSENNDAFYINEPVNSVTNSPETLENISSDLPTNNSSSFSNPDLQKQERFEFAKTVRTKTNYHGGILGGITSGMPIICRLAFKPTPSIGIEQDSISLSLRKSTKLIVEGRHDPCVVLRAVPICEAALALGILDAMLEK